MSLRSVVKSFYQNGRILYRRYLGTYIKNTIVDVPKLNINPSGVDKNLGSSGSFVNSGFSSWKNVIHTHARKLLISNVLNRVTQPWNAELRKRATKRLFYGDSTPFFALVGVGLASGSGLLTKDDELEGVCWEIREAISKIQWNISKIETESNLISGKEPASLEEIILGEPIAKGCNGVVYAAKLKSDETCHSDSNDVINYPLAVKMIFNYYIESNASTIIRAMFRETVPARSYFFNTDLSNLQLSLTEGKKHLPPHRNIVAMYSVFADRVPDLPQTNHLYTDALPSRIDPAGSGRNMSLFLVMKRYDCSLKDYIESRHPPARVSVLLLAQLLEAVTHMNSNSIAHRDLKCDNILLDMSEGTNTCPMLTVTDFGCCLADSSCGLVMPYPFRDVDTGGNTVLMAPEVATAKPGRYSTINYTKSDLWVVGTIAYELFNLVNPFYDKSLNLRSTDYDERDLPELGDDVPPLVKKLIRCILSRNPSNRPSAELAATVVQLFLWAPSSWVKKDCGVLPNSNEILQWLLSLATKILCEGRVSCLKLTNSTDDNLQNNMGNRRTLPEYELIASFLRRIKLSTVRRALQWIHNEDI